MEGRWKRCTLWLLLVLGSAVLPALHRATHHGAPALATIPQVQADEACALCLGLPGDAPEGVQVTWTRTWSLQVWEAAPVSMGAWMTPAQAGRAPPQV